MIKIKKIQHSDTEYQLSFMCPACKDTHEINQSWEFNEDYELPTISPSILTEGVGWTYGEMPDNFFELSTDEQEKHRKPWRCHSWITKGRIKFFKDCSHELAGQQWFDLIEM